jgi:hypothetical protein
MTTSDQLTNAERELELEHDPGIKNIDLQDTLDDLLLGIELWKEHKVGHMTWDNEDEMLARWVEARPAREES